MVRTRDNELDAICELDAILPIVSITINMPTLWSFSPRQRQRFIQYLTLIISIAVCATASLLESLIQPEPEPYHTSILTGEGWVVELLTGHPGRIRCELGMHAHAFQELVSLIQSYGHENTRLVLLEEQVAIFLYTCVTGLPMRHVGERFQHSNDTTVGMPVMHTTGTAIPLMQVRGDASQGLFSRCDIV